MSREMLALSAGVLLWVGSAVWAEETTVRQVMEQVTAPESDAIFGVTDPPSDASAWAAVADHAAAIAGTRAALLAMAPPTAAEDWRSEVDAHVRAVEAVARAARIRDFDALLEASDSLASTCLTCHKKYLGK